MNVGKTWGFGRCRRALASEGGPINNALSDLPTSSVSWFIAAPASLPETGGAMPTTPREYLYVALMVAAAALPVAGVVVFWRAGSFQGYISALLLLALAAVSLLAARELKPRKTSDTPTTVAN